MREGAIDSDRASQKFLTAYTAQFLATFPYLSPLIYLIFSDSAAFFPGKDFVTKPPAVQQLIPSFALQDSNCPPEPLLFLRDKLYDFAILLIPKWPIVIIQLPSQRLERCSIWVIYHLNDKDLDQQV